MARRWKRLRFLFLLMVQVIPVIIIVHYAFRFKTPTENAGWIFEPETGCKCWTNANFENRSFKWSGECSNGFANGTGRLRLMQHGHQYALFEGTLLEGKAEGFGRIVWLDGDSFEGEYRDGLPNGPGKASNDEGDYYEGNFINGHRSGQGTYWYEPGGSILKYSGSWKDGLKEGKGTFYYRDGTQTTGLFHQGELTKTSQ